MDLSWEQELEQWIQSQRILFPASLPSPSSSIVTDLGPDMQPRTFLPAKRLTVGH